MASEGMLKTMVPELIDQYDDMVYKIRDFIGVRISTIACCQSLLLPRSVSVLPLCNYLPYMLKYATDAV